MKHIPIKYHFVREEVAKKNIKVEYIGTKEQIANILTRPLPRETFEYLCQKLGILPSSNLKCFYPAKQTGSAEAGYRSTGNRQIVKGSHSLPLMSKGERKQVKKIRGMMSRGAVIAQGVHVLSSMTKGEVVDRQLSLMSTQAAPRVSRPFVAQNAMVVHGLSCQEHP